jgi:hypothetical protein
VSRHGSIDHLIGVDLDLPCGAGLSAGFASVASTSINSGGDDIHGEDSTRRKNYMASDKLSFEHQRTLCRSRPPMNCLSWAIAAAGRPTIHASSGEC